MQEGVFSGCFEETRRYLHIYEASTGLPLVRTVISLILSFPFDNFTRRIKCSIVSNQVISYLVRNPLTFHEKKVKLFFKVKKEKLVLTFL